MKKLFLLLFLSGCFSSPKSLDLDIRWLPLKRIVECPKIRAEGVYCTQGHTIYTHSLEEFLSLGIIHQEALLAHEQIHAVHQSAMGVEIFKKKYAENAAFRKSEETAAWTAQIIYIELHGLKVDVIDTVLEIHTRYFDNDNNPLFSKQEALELVWDAKKIVGRK